MKILVDADACPVKQQIMKEAKAQGIPVTMLMDTSHTWEDGYSTVITVDKGRDSADIRLANLILKGDIIVTQDYGVAALALGRGAFAINQNGRIYDDTNMDRLLLERHLGQKIRRAGGRGAKISKRTPQDDAAFEEAFHKLCTRVESKNSDERM